jgi:hypothetical protein
MTKLANRPYCNNQEYDKGHGLFGRQHSVEKSCTYCGGLNPDTFMDWVRNGGKITPTDKSYKVYIQCPYVDPRNGEVKEETSSDGIKITSYYGMEAKFYFDHLNKQQAEEFVELLTERKISFKYPGYFYTIPYLAALKDEED